MRREEGLPLDSHALVLSPVASESYPCRVVNYGAAGDGGGNGRRKRRAAAASGGRSPARLVERGRG